MKWIRFRRILQSLAFCVLAALCASPAGSQGPGVGSLVVVVHEDVQLEDISVDRLRRIFMSDQQHWPNGAKIVVLIQAPGTAERQAILAKIFRMTEPEYKRFWVGRIFRGDVTSGPKMVLDARAMPELVRAIPGVIAAIDESEVLPGMKVLRVDGKLPDAETYPFRR